MPGPITPLPDHASLFAALLRHIPREEIPATEDILSADQLEARLEEMPPYDLVLVGDIMLGDKLAHRIDEAGVDYPFASVLPLLRKSALVVGNLEAPFATGQIEPTERYAYRVQPDHVRVLTNAGISAVNLANNHLLDCGRDGVLETLETLDRVGIGTFGAGRDDVSARKPLIQMSGSLRIGMVGYYWNPRCAASATQSGCVMSDPALIYAAVKDLRLHVDYLVASFHWGDTYSREPSQKAQMKARLAIDAGADLVVGHHPHILQPFEIYKGRPIFYSMGNCVMGSGNSRAEGIAVAVRTSQKEAAIDLYPLYVKNRDPRINYQTKVLSGPCAKRLLTHLKSNSLIEAGARASTSVML